MGAGGSCSKTAKDNPIPEVEPMEPIEVGKFDSFLHNEIREVTVTPDFTLLVSEFEGKIYAYGSKCPHYGAQMKNGALMDGMIRCPWHGACFDIRTGDIEDHPGMDCIPVYKTTTEKNGMVKVHPTHPGVYKIHRSLGPCTIPLKTMLILGAGPAALMFAKTLREQYFEERIVMLTKDAYLPYDRPKLSKIPGIDWEDCKLRKEDWFTTASVECMLGVTISHVDLDRREVFLEDAEHPIRYNKLLIATGLRPRIPTKPRERETSKSGSVEGIDLKGVLTLYSLKDSALIKAQTEDKEVVIMGSGFIAMELVSSLHNHCKKITVLGRSKRPYGAVLGETVGRIMQQKIQEKWKNIEFFGCEEVKEIRGDGDASQGQASVINVLTSKKREIPCQAVIYAIGAVPNTEFLLPKPTLGEELGTSIPKYPLNGLSSGYIPTNEFMESSLEGVWIAGDIARIPLHASISGYASVGHIAMAQKMGRIAALGVMGIKHSIATSIPFFWTNVLGVNLRYVGYGEDYNKTEIYGDLQALKFCILYRREGKILAACTLNCDPIAAKLAFDMEDGVDFEKHIPDYISEVFPNPPIIGEALNNVKFTQQRDLAWDLTNYSQKMKGLWSEVEPKLFNSLNYRDIDYRFISPNTFINESRLAQKSRLIPPPIVTKFFTHSKNPQMEKYRFVRNFVDKEKVHKQQIQKLKAYQKSKQQFDLE